MAIVYKCQNKGIYKCQNNGMPPSQAAGGSGPVWKNEMCSCQRDYSLLHHGFGHIGAQLVLPLLVAFALKIQRLQR